jgi:hypothetical protein
MVFYDHRPGREGRAYCDQKERCNLRDKLFSFIPPGSMCAVNDFPFFQSALYRKSSSNPFLHYIVYFECSVNLCLCRYVVGWFCWREQWRRIGGLALGVDRCWSGGNVVFDGCNCCCLRCSSQSKQRAVCRSESSLSSIDANRAARRVHDECCSSQSRYCLDRCSLYVTKRCINQINSRVHV